jgi:hypothetical protein
VCGPTTASVSSSSFHHYLPTTLTGALNLRYFMGFLVSLFVVSSYGACVILLSFVWMTEFVATLRSPFVQSLPSN